MEWATRAAQDAGLDPTARHVLLVLAYHASTKWGRCYASAATIAAETGYGEQTVRRAMARIRAAKIVDCDRRRGQTAMWIFPNAAPRYQVPGSVRFAPPDIHNPGTSRREPRYQIPGTPVPSTDEQVIEQEKLTRSDAVARRPGDAVAPGEKPNLRVVTPAVAFAPGTGRIPNWSRGEQ
jgi:hypothetical protein